uniref:Uncharacterized protein n=1 Tax=Arundo donax TaxID=35708 RepID=A0A0A9C058_ARUDO
MDRGSNHRSWKCYYYISLVQYVFGLINSMRFYSITWHMLLFHKATLNFGKQ